MGDTTIEWTDKTWNPVRGCSRVSEGCRKCYAERVAHRFSGPGQPYEGLTAKDGRWNGTVRLVEEHLTDPLRWKKPCKIFVNSMSDLFHESLPFEAIDQVFAVMALCPQHTFQVLTKRAERMAEYMLDSRDMLGFKTIYERVRALMDQPGQPIRPIFAKYVKWPLPNVWLGMSVENQEAADARIPHLLRTPAAVRFLSVEPMLGAVDLERIDYGDPPGSLRIGNRKPVMNALRGYCDNGMDTQLHWVICGGESGAGARPMHPDWARSLRDQCVAAGVPFFFKQWGEYLEEEATIQRLGRDYCDRNFWEPWGRGACATDKIRRFNRDGSVLFEPGSGHLDGHKTLTLLRVGKKKAGRTLDDMEWNEFPKTEATPCPTKP